MMLKSFFLSKNSPYLIVGLGNPKEKYENTRHNIGFSAIDKINQLNNFPVFDFSKKTDAEISKGTIEEKSVFLAKPKTFMNLSGKSIIKIAQFYKIDFRKMIVIHDDIDIPLGKIKIVKNRGSGGHRGIDSIIKETGKKDFIRIRVGISPEKKPEDATSFVLQKFKEEERVVMDKVLEEIKKSIDLLIKEGVEKSASIFNK